MHTAMLILIVFGMSSVSTDHIGFSSVEKCQAAATALVATSTYGHEVQATCVED